MTETVAALRDLDTVLATVVDAQLRDGGVQTLESDELLAVMDAAAALVRRAEALLVDTVGQVDARSGQRDVSVRMTTDYGCRSVKELVQRTTRLSSRRAGDLVTAGRGVREATTLAGEALPAAFPAMREALIDGVTGVDGVVAVAGPLNALPVGREAILAADEELAAAARGEGADDEPPLPADDLHAQALVWAAYLDQDGPEPRDARALRKREVTLGACRDGLVPLRGHLLPDVAAQLQRIFDSILNPKLEGRAHPGPTHSDITPEATVTAMAERVGGPRFTTDDEMMRSPAYADERLYGHQTRSDDDVRHHDHDHDDMYVVAGDDAAADTDPGVEGEGPQSDTRTRGQKQHDALATALSVAAASGQLPTIGGGAPTLVVSASQSDLETGAGTAHVQGIDEPVALAIARQIACTGAIQRVRMDENGRIVAITVNDRVFTHFQRKAIVLRDGECVIPGCHVPAAWCEIHHVLEAALGGPTHTDNGVLLCWFHHRTIDTGPWRVRMRHGVPEIRGPVWWDPAQRWRNVTKSPIRKRELLTAARRN